MGFSVNVLEGGDSCGAYFLGFWLHGSPTLVESDMNPRKRGLKFSLVFESAIFGGSVVELSQRKQNQQIESLTFMTRHDTLPVLSSAAGMSGSILSPPPRMLGGFAQV